MPERPELVRWNRLEGILGLKIADEAVDVRQSVEVLIRASRLVAPCKVDAVGEKRKQI